LLQDKKAPDHRKLLTTTKNFFFEEKKTFWKKWIYWNLSHAPKKLTQWINIKPNMMYNHSGLTYAIECSVVCRIHSITSLFMEPLHLNRVKFCSKLSLIAF
jgi:hypothetical protein